jgi:hypothetical protein
MKKLIAMFGILALAACGGGDAEEGATTEDTTAVTPVTETAPVTTTDTTMAAPAAMPMDSGAAMTDSTADSATVTP